VVDRPVTVRMRWHVNEVDAVPPQFQVGDDLFLEQDLVRESRTLEARMDLTGHGAAADVSLLFEDEWTTACFGEIEGGDQRVVAGADDDRVVHAAVRSIDSGYDHELRVRRSDSITGTVHNSSATKSHATVVAGRLSAAGGGVAVVSIAVRPRDTKLAIMATMVTAAATIPGRALDHGNGMAGGAEASARTASMTRATKPDEGTISSPERKPSRSSRSMGKLPP